MRVGSLTCVFRRNFEAWDQVTRMLLELLRRSRRASWVYWSSLSWTNADYLNTPLWLSLHRGCTWHQLNGNLHLSIKPCVLQAVSLATKTVGREYPCCQHYDPKSEQQFIMRGVWAKIDQQKHTPQSMEKEETTVLKTQIQISWVTYLQVRFAVHAYLQLSINLFTSLVSAAFPATVCSSEWAVSSKLSTAALTTASATSTAVWTFLYSWNRSGIKLSTCPFFCFFYGNERSADTSDSCHLRWKPEWRGEIRLGGMKNLSSTYIE